MATANVRAVITADDKASATLGQFGKNVSSVSDRIKTGLKVAAISAGAAVGYSLVKNLDNAIKRVDTLNNSARTFENMGFKTKNVDKAMKALDKSIRGLPTSLDEGVRGVQSLAATYDDVIKGQQVFSAVNDAVLGFGGSAVDVEGAIQQLSQVPMDGPLDAQTWNSLRQRGLTPALVAMAKKFGMTLGELKGALGDKGKLTVRDFTDALVELDKRGGGGMKSFQQIAKDSTKGIQTSWENMQTAIARGLANIINSIGQANIANAIRSVGQAFEFSLSQVINVMNILSYATGFLTNNMGTILPVLSLLGTAFIALRAKMAFDAAINAIILGFNTLRLIVIPSLMASLTALQAFMATPFGLAVGIASLAVAALTSGFINNKIQANQLKQAQDALRNATNQLKDANLAAAHADLQVKESKLQVKLAQDQLTNAIKQYGPHSLQAKQATLQLKEAELGVKDASNAATKAHKSLNNIETTISKNTSLIKHLQQVRANLQGVGRDALNAGQQIQRIDGSKVTVKTSKNKVGQQTIDFVSTFGRRALGGPIRAGMPYLVGERGPEMIVPEKSGTVIPNNKLPSGGTTNITIAPQIGVYTGTPTERRKLALTILSDLRDLANQKSTTVSELLGANRPIPMS